jgi:hypothetical protein
VYFIRGGNAVKIGRTFNVEARQRALATGSAVPLELLAEVPGDRDLEAQLHLMRVRSRTVRHIHAVHDLDHKVISLRSRRGSRC